VFIKPPPNGSLAANLSLLATGALAGVVVTWWLVPGRGLDPAFSPPREGSSEPRPSAPRFALITRGVDGPRSSGLKPPPAMTALERGGHYRKQGAEAAGRDLAGALAAADRIESAQDRLDYVRGVYGVWSDQDPAGALEHARTGMPAGRLRSEAIGIAMSKWGQDHPREAWMWAEQNLSGPLKERALTDLMMGWTRRNPQEAADWLASTGLTSQPFFNALPGTWAERDPAAALAWTERLPDGKAKATAEVAVASTVAADDPAKAAAMFAERIESGDNAAVTISIADIWATTDPAATASWIDGMAEGPGKSEAAATLATVWAASDIRAAVGWSGNIGDPSMRGQVIANIGTTWGAIEPLEALQWLGNLPPAEAAAGITGAMYSWAGTDPVGLREWVDQASGNPLADQARRSLGDVLSQQAIPDALDVAMGIDSPEARDAAMARYFREWRKRDDASAQDWLDARWAGLPAGTQDALAGVQGQALRPK
jgi:hypothetical protein